MQEDLLQFIWQHNLYRPAGLRTTDGVAVQVLHPGTINRDAGPDFGAARIRIGDLIFVGQVELHIRSSDWNRHRHDADDAYKRIILHVVYEHDTDALPGGFPVLELGPHIPESVIEQYSRLIRNTAPLPCATGLHLVAPLTRTSWLSRMLAERWEGRLAQWEAQLKAAGSDWQTLLYHRLAANFGFKVNAAPFEALAQSLPLKLITRQPGLFGAEALIFGQSGLLAGSYRDDYPQRLQAEYAFLKGKYGLRPMEPSLWKFLRLRPANFPTIRLAQFAVLLHGGGEVFTGLGSRSDVDSLSRKLTVRAGAYWNNHYTWDQLQARATPKQLGGDAIRNIIMNTIAPVRYLYARMHGQDSMAEAALDLLDALPPEDNNIIRMWAKWGWQPETAGSSQALIQLYNHYCISKRCLECAVGLSLLRSRPDK